ncbi:hypothetical protein pb186bvf_008049 [Paramecium bursaria]
MNLRQILSDKEKVLQITKAAFKVLDKDGSQFLERRELQEIMNNSAFMLKIDRPSTEEVDEVLKDLDKNQDGKLSLDEFQTLIEQVLEIMAKMEEK